MGLLDFLQNLFKAPIPSRFEDLFNYDYPALLKKSTFKGTKLDDVYSIEGYEDEEGEEKLIYFEYECAIYPPFLNALTH